MPDPFVGTTIFGRRVAAVRGNDGSVILQQDSDDERERMTLSLSAESAAELWAWLRQHEDGGTRIKGG